MNTRGDDPEKTDLADVTTYQAGIVQANAYRILKQAVNNYLQPYSLSMMEWFALGTIRDTGRDGIRPTELAKTLQTTMPYTTTLLHTLEAKEWIERTESPADNRVKLVRLADGADSSCKKIEADLRAKMRDHIYSRITRDDFATYIRTLYSLGRP